MKLPCTYSPVVAAFLDSYKDSLAASIQRLEEQRADAKLYIKEDADRYIGRVSADAGHDGKVLFDLHSDITTTADKISLGITSERTFYLREEGRTTNFVEKMIILFDKDVTELFTCSGSLRYYVPGIEAYADSIKAGLIGAPLSAAVELPSPIAAAGDLIITDIDNFCFMLNTEAWTADNRFAMRTCLEQARAFI